MLLPCATRLQQPATAAGGGTAARNACLPAAIRPLLTPRAPGRAGSLTSRRAEPLQESAGGQRVETPELRLERQLRETEQVESRVRLLRSKEELEQALDAAGNDLCILEVQGEEVCETGLGEEPELHWREDQREALAKKMAACERIKSTFQRTAREASDVQFLEVQVSDDIEGRQLMAELGVGTLPTIQYYRQGKLLWEQIGSVGMEQELGEGVLFLGDQAANGLRTGNFVKELGSLEEQRAFVEAEPCGDDMLKVVMVGTTSRPCIKAYPALFALARSFAQSERKITEFARLLVEDSDKSVPELTALNILEVPTMIFYRGKRETGRLVSSSRGDLIGTILQQLMDAGISPPPPPSSSTKASRQRKARVMPRSKW